MHWINKKPIFRYSRIFPWSSCGGVENYSCDDVHNIEVVAAITPNDVMRYMNLKLFETIDSRDDDEGPMLVCENTLAVYKKAISFCSCQIVRFIPSGRTPSKDFICSPQRWNFVFLPTGLVLMFKEEWKVNYFSLSLDVTRLYGSTTASSQPRLCLVKSANAASLPIGSGWDRWFCSD